MGSVSQQSPKEGNQVDSSLGNNRSRKLEGWDCVLEPWGRRRGKCVCLGRRQGSSPEKQEQELNWEVHPRRKETDLQEARQMAGIRIWKAKLTGSIRHVKWCCGLKYSKNIVRRSIGIVISIDKTHWLECWGRGNFVLKMASEGEAKAPETRMVVKKRQETRQWGRMWNWKSVCLFDF